MSKLAWKLRRISSLNHGLWFWTGAPCSPQRTPDFLSSLLALANFMRLSLMKAAHAGIGGAPCRKSGYMGRKRIFQMLSLHARGFLLLDVVFCPRSSSVGRGCAPSFSAHVRPTASRGRLGEHGAPVQGRGLRSLLQPQRRRWGCIQAETFCSRVLRLLRFIPPARLASDPAWRRAWPAAILPTAIQPLELPGRLQIPPDPMS